MTGVTDVDPSDQAAFDALQARLVPLWSSLGRLNHDEQTIVVIPSADVDVQLSASELQAYEERFLFLLFLLRQPRARMVFVTGQRIAEEIVDYYLDLLPGVIGSNARKRLFFISPMEARFRPLAEKLLDRPHLIEEIRSLVPDRNRAHLIPFMTTWADRELAMRLDIPMYGADPAHTPYGTKSEARKLFARAGIAHPRGSENLRTRSEVVEALGVLMSATPGIERAIVKLDEGISGFGNAIVDLTEARPGIEGDLDAVLGRLEVHEAIGDASAFFDHLALTGGVVEEMVEGSEVRSPSVQLRVTPLGQVELLSTHDQILGGVSGQVFVGSRFPADPSYAGQISTDAVKVGELLAEAGVIGRFALDFVVVRRDDGAWDHYAIELNLRKGGTTQPFLTLQFLTDGTYLPDEASFVAPDGRAKHYVAADHVLIDGLDALRPQDLLDLAVLHDLHFDQARQTGVVFHMLSAMPTHGFVGVTCIEDSPAAAGELYDRVIGFLQDQARRMGRTSR